MKNKFFIFLAGLFVFNMAFSFVFAQTPLQTPPPNIDVVGVLNKVANLLIEFATPIAIIMVVVAGFYFITAQGDPNKIETAKKMVLWALIGMAVVYLAKATIIFVKTLLGG